MRSALTFLSCLALLATIGQNGAKAQQPASQQLVIQAANTAPAPAPARLAAAAAAAATNNASSLQTALKALQQTKAANEETLKKQEAMLAQLDELQKAADQLKIFAKRG